MAPERQPQEHEHAAHGDQTTPATSKPADGGEKTIACTHPDGTLLGTDEAPWITRLEKQSIGPYRITGFVGHGGTALVYAAEDVDGAPVALKVMEETPTLPATLLKRFLREAEAAKKLRRHPNIVTIYDTGHDGTSHYIAMELVSGPGSLDRVLKEERLAVRRALEIAVAVAKALEYAHAEGIVHRDLKPGNVLMSEFGEPLLADFGLARLTTAQDQLTMTCSGLGTPHYMSPEQTESSQVGPQSDIYSFGVLLYEMLTGRLPYIFPENAGMGQILDIIRYQRPANPRRYRRGISRNLAAVVTILLEKETRLRYQTMTDVIADLQACLERRPVNVRRPHFFERLDALIRRHRAAAAMAAGTTLTFAALWLNYSHQLERERLSHLSPVLEAERTSRELEQLKTRSSMLPPVDDAPFDKRVDYGHLLLLNGDADIALRVFRELHAQQALSGDDGYAFTAALELARTLIAVDRPAEAAPIYEAVESLDVPHFGRQIAAFERGLAVLLAGDITKAHALWRTMLADQGLEDEVLGFVRAALGDLTPERIATDAGQRSGLFKAYGFWLASRAGTDSGQWEEWLQAATTAAQDSAPWLYYFLKHGKMSDNSR